MKLYVCALLIVLCGCQPRLKETKLVREFFGKYMSASAEAEAEFRKHTLEEQYELYRFGMEVVHPPMMYLAKPFAEQGPIVVPFLMGKLNETEDEYAVCNIVLLLKEVALQGRYDFSKDPETMRTLNSRVNAMQGPWKEIALDMLSKIKSAAEEEREK